MPAGCLKSLLTFLSSLPFSAAPMGPHLVSFLSKANTAHLRSWICTQLLAFHDPHRILNISISGSLQSRLLLIITALASSSLLVSSRSRASSPQAGPYSSCLQLSSAESLERFRNLLVGLCPDMFPLPLMSGRLKIPRRTRDSDQRLHHIV